MNRRLLIALGLVVAVVVGLAALGATTGGDSPNEPELRAVGAPASVCSPVSDLPATGESDHRAGEIVYDRVPPNSGPHAPNWLNPFKRRYEPADGVPVEQVVHNLEHGWVVIWYSPSSPGLAVLDQALAATDTRKLLAVPWDRTPLPAPYVLTAWGHEQRCSEVSGAAIADFLADHGGENGDAPEPEAP